MRHDRLRRAGHHLCLEPALCGLGAVQSFPALSPIIPHSFFTDLVVGGRCGNGGGGLPNGLSSRCSVASAFAVSGSDGDPCADYPPDAPHGGYSPGGCNVTVP